MLVDSMLKRAEICLKIDCSTPATNRTRESMCYLELIGNRKVSKPGSKGGGKRTYPYKLTCVCVRRQNTDRPAPVDYTDLYGGARGTQNVFYALPKSGHALQSTATLV